MDVVLTVLARKILLSSNDSNLAIEVGAFCFILIVRLLWTRYGGLHEETSPHLGRTQQSSKESSLSPSDSGSDERSVS
ncbi:hypothetical protein BM613_09565 [Sulfoacidibacillus thermotolerans]|uniref:Uncharacterized protein n=1 Tax=Sulfoacidibacillus thermotolerans TaxID=1765684 RepID=A0A2U3D7G4_SULT2|nr:hypothetical protein BM613_09565 [Sulfoacidibacillus thermotolerans]